MHWLWLEKGKGNKQKTLVCGYYYNIPSKCVLQTPKVQASNTVVLLPLTLRETKALAHPFPNFVLCSLISSHTILSLAFRVSRLILFLKYKHVSIQRHLH